jgi:ATP-dependent DNA helicase RecG
MNSLQPPAQEKSLSNPEKSLSVAARLRALQTPLRFLKGVGPKRAAQLERTGLKTIEDLLYHLPFRYEDRRSIGKLGNAIGGKEGSFVGRLINVQRKWVPQRRVSMLSATLQDDTAAIELVWYRAPTYLVSSLSEGQMLLVHGKVEHGAGARKKIIHPEFVALESGEESRLERILPVYIRPGGLPLSLLRKWISEALAQYGACLPGRLPKETIGRQKLLPLREALHELHEPSLNADIGVLNGCSSAAHRSVIFDEIFYLQLALGLRKQSRQQRAGISFASNAGDLSARMRAMLPFKLTGAQERVLAEIFKDLQSGCPMQRLVQGDVGSGKTMVAWLASLWVMDHGRQALWLAPTELLAEQHYRNLIGFAAALEIPCALLTASVPVREKKHLLARIEAGEVRFVVGTHALIQETVRVPRMGLGVIDEQHRFGVMQRLSLQSLTGGAAGAESGGVHPHVLLMSATPIPRSLAMVLYGDMEVSFLDQMPPGRSPVRTQVFAARDRRAVYARVLDELRRGHQAFIIYPLVEASEQLEDVRDATQMAETMRERTFKDFGVGLVHGRMSADERDQVMRAFRGGKIGVLVATTVVEVGIDIPNATLIVIEHAERFGLSQLHQLRGRVGRGSAPGQCLLVNRGTNNTAAAERLRVMEKENDGFRVAEADLALRGPGELMGTRQSGLADFRLANLIRDAELFVTARKEAQDWLEKDPELKRRESGGLREILEYRWERRLQLGTVG